MKKMGMISFLLVTLLVTVKNADAYLVNLSDFEGQPYHASALIEGDGTSSITVTLDLTNGTVADFRGFFFDYTNDSIDYGAVSITGDDVTAWYIDYHIYNSFSPSAKLTGDSHDFAAGVEIGTNGETPDDIQDTSFVISYAKGLSLGDYFGVRLMSVANEDGERELSGKLIGTEDTPPPTTGTVPEPATFLLFSSALAGAFAVGKRQTA
jgi:hypothetical protein